MIWTIDGVVHTGQILTVGPSGRDYTHPQDAYAAASPGALILCDPGIYNLKIVDDIYYAFNAASKLVYIRGLGDSATETVFSGEVGNHASFLFKFGIVENIRFLHKPTAAWTRALAYGANDTHMKFSKCEIDASFSGNSYCLASEWMEDHSNVLVEFLNCKLIRAFTHLTGQNPTNWAIDLSKIRLSKCESNGGLAVQYSKNSFALSDYVPLPTLGYGYNYGDFLIKQESSVTVLTSAATEISSSQFTANGRIDELLEDPITERGFCYKEGTEGDPTVYDSVVSEQGSFVVGDFSLLVTGIVENTPYRVRAYALKDSILAYGDTVDVSPEKIRYWIGKKGNFFDSQNWSLHSGGAGGASVPDSTSRVIVDANSFDGRGQFISFKE